MKKRLFSIVLVIFVSFAFTSVLAQDVPSAPGEAFPQIDTDRDGKITKGEYMAFQEMKFKKMDTNADGVLTQDEMTEVVRTRRESRLRRRQK
ncbi:MAG: EF-hand domain-containing protein [Candidatus Aerophobus sp.]|nr:MAG: EF-hand domain-containing protein [Candidatus Aerophobus sp.]